MGKTFFDLSNPKDIHLEATILENYVLESKVEINDYKMISLLESKYDDKYMAPPTFVERTVEFMKKMILWFSDTIKKIHRFINNVLNRVIGNLGILQDTLRKMKNELLAHFPVEFKSFYPTLKSEKDFKDLEKRFLKSFSGINSIKEGRDGRFGGDVLDSLRDYRAYLERLPSNRPVALKVEPSQVRGIVNSAYRIARNCKQSANFAVNTCKNGLDEAKTNVRVYDKSKNVSRDFINKERRKIHSYRSIISEILYLNSRTVKILNSQGNKISITHIKNGIEYRKSKRAR